MSSAFRRDFDPVDGSVSGVGWALGGGVGRSNLEVLDGG